MGGLQVLFYISTLVFVVGVVYKGVKMARMPLHLRWDLYPIPHEGGGKGKYGGSYYEEVEWWTKPANIAISNEMKEAAKEILPVSLWPVSLRGLRGPDLYRRHPGAAGYGCNGRVDQLRRTSGVSSHLDLRPQRSGAGGTGRRGAVLLQDLPKRTVPDVSVDGLLQRGPAGRRVCHHPLDLGHRRSDVCSHPRLCCRPDHLQTRAGHGADRLRSLHAGGPFPAVAALYAHDPLRRQVLHLSQGAVGGSPQYPGQQDGASRGRCAGLHDQMVGTAHQVGRLVG